MPYTAENLRSIADFLDAVLPLTQPESPTEPALGLPVPVIINGAVTGTIVRDDSDALAFWPTPVAAPSQPVEAATDTDDDLPPDLR